MMNPNTFPDVLYYNNRKGETPYQTTSHRFATARLISSSLRKTPMKMDEVRVRDNKVTAAIAKAFAESEFEKYRIIQDCLYQSDFDKLIATAQEDKES